VLQLVDQANAKLLAALRVMDDNIFDMSSLGASTKELLFNNQGPRSDDSALVQLLNHNNMIHILASTHLFKRLLEGLFRDFSDDCESGQAVVEALGVVCDLERADAVALGELGLHGGGD